ncbi:MAG: hypothetical protein CML02_00100 [Pseudooceanicola sp.]|nr:hypothetical protein [Pseudooceanicola sp.]|tara:strand:+ start:367 stop:1107 length:741 start_codon:yes stop_codon:yes gene_type:complete
MTTTLTALSIGGAHNFRDLGGIPLRDGGRTAPGRIYRSCALVGLAPLQQAKVEALGLTCALDLRSEAESARNPGGFHGLASRISVPLFATLAPAAEVLAEAPGARLVLRYIGALTDAQPAFAEAMTHLARAPDGPIAFNCTVGKDRTGLIAALLLDLTGADRAAIAANYAETEDFAPGLLARLASEGLAAGADPAIMDRLLRAEAQTMHKVLSFVDDRFGGSRSFLSQAGVSPADLDRLAGRVRGT